MCFCALSCSSKRTFGSGVKFFLCRNKDQEEEEEEGGKKEEEREEEEEEREEGEEKEEEEKGEEKVASLPTLLPDPSSANLPPFSNEHPKGPNFLPRSPLISTSLSRLIIN